MRRRLRRRALRLLSLPFLPLQPRRKARPKVGLPPGTLVYTGPEREQPVRIQAMSFDAGECVEHGDVDPAAIASLRRPGRVTWINVEGVHDTTVIEAVGGVFGIDSLVLEDIVRLGQRPKLDGYEGYLFIVLRMFVYEAEQEHVRHEQLSLILGHDYVITFQEMSGDVLDVVRQRLRDGKGRIRSWGADYLAYAILDIIVDNYFVVLEQLSERIDEIEEVVTQVDGREVVAAIHRLKRENLFLRRSTWPLRELVSGLARSEHDIVDERLRPFLRDLHDHTIEIVDTIETLRDMLAGMLDVYLSSVSNRMNQVMKVLTIITTLFVPLTFIAGIYGMNFTYMPELHERWAYPAVLALMAILLVGMLAIFRRKDWF